MISMSYVLPRVNSGWRVENGVGILSDISITRYEAYKDSGVEWLGNVPAHWINGRVKDFVNTNALTKVPSGLLPVACCLIA